MELNTIEEIEGNSSSSMLGHEVFDRIIPAAKDELDDNDQDTPISELSGLSDLSNFNDHDWKPNSVPMMFMCAKCQASFKSSSELEDHVTSEHSKDILSCKKKFYYTCNKCSKSFKYSYILRNHKKVAHKLQKNKDCRSVMSCPKMFASGANLKKHGQIHDLELYLNIGIKSDIQKRNSVNEEQKSVRKSMRANRNYWCRVCSSMSINVDEYNRHMLKHPKAKSNVFDRNSEQAHLSPNKSIKKTHSSTKQAMDLDNSKHQVKIEAITDSQEQPILSDDNQITVGHAKSHHVEGGMYNFIQPVQEFSDNGNMPNVQFIISVSSCQNALQNDLESIPKFDFHSEVYMDWLKTFIHKCECQEFPFSRVLVKQIIKVNDDIFTALIDLKNKNDHLYLMSLYKSLEAIMYNNVKYNLTKRT